MKFWKMSGAGNDFVLVEKGSAALARRLCDRRAGVGADGLLAVSKNRVDYYNSDGSKAFCGNGTRCAAYWLMKRCKSSSISLRTHEGVLNARSTASGRVAVQMPAPGPVRKKAGVYLINTGVPHAVVFVRSVKSAPVETKGPLLRRRFGANVNFVERKGRRLKIRTFERGVEGETLACGTGVVAAAVVAWSLKKAKPPIKVRAQGGDLSVSFTPKNGRAAELWLEGPAETVFTGEL